MTKVWLYFDFENIPLFFMKIVSSVLLVVLVAAVSADDRIGPIPILKSENVQNDDGSYAFS